MTFTGARNMKSPKDIKSTAESSNAENANVNVNANANANPIASASEGVSKSVNENAATGASASASANPNASIASVTTQMSTPAVADSKSDTESVASDWQSAKAEQDMSTMKQQMADMALELEIFKARQAQYNAEIERRRQAEALAYSNEMQRIRNVQAQQAEAARIAQANANAQAKANADAQAKANANAQAAAVAAAQQAAAKELADTIDPQQLQARLQACNNRGDRNGYFAEMKKWQDAVKRSGPK